MLIQEKIKNKADEFGKLGTVFLEGGDFALNNQWISVNDDLPCNHEELLSSFYTNFTNEVLAVYENKYIALDRMVKDDKGDWKFVGAVLYWMPIPEPPKEQEVK